MRDELAPVVSLDEWKAKKALTKIVKAVEAKPLDFTACPPLPGASDVLDASRYMLAGIVPRVIKAKPKKDAK